MQANEFKKNTIHTISEAHCSATRLANRDPNMLRIFFDEALMISSKMNYIYVHIPKCGCSSVMATLWFHEHRLGHVEHLYPGTPHTMRGSPWWPKNTDANRSTWGEAIKSRFVFTVARNPFVRLLSCYLDKINIDSVLTGTLLKVMGTPERTTPISFAEFIETIAAQNAFDMDKHWRIQTEQSYLGLIKYDFIGRIESFTTDMTFVMGKIFDDKNLPLVRGGTQRHAKELIDTYYDRTTAKIVLEKYWSDFEFFGYYPDIDMTKEVRPKSEIFKSENDESFLATLRSA